jgi:hypothetical protein
VIQKKIFNHDIMHCTHDAVAGNYLYSGRVLGVSEPDDLIQLHPDLKSQWKAITAHYQRIGLSYSQNPIWDVSFDRLSDYPDREVSVFIFTDDLQQGNFTGDRDWLEVVEFINSKNNFIRLAQELGVRVPKTLCLENKLALKDISDIPFPCYLKPAISVDGVGIYRCENEQQLAKFLNHLDDNLPFQLQEEVIASKFLNMQYYATVNGAEPLAATEQILDGFTHMGNRYPTADRPWELVDPMAEWMVAKGMKGIFAFDVAVVAEAENSYVAIECNPRFNGASYPTGIAQKLNIKSWSSENFTTTYRSLDDIDLSGIEFDSESGKGVAIVNWGSVLVGKLGILLAGSLEERERLRGILKERL